MKISNNKLITLTYDLNVGEEGEERILMEQATTEKPLEFIFGTDSMLESFEKHLDGLSAGDKFSFTLSPDETYGEYNEDKVLKLTKKIFEIDGKVDEEMLFEGNTLPMIDADGNRLMGIILEINGDEITMDFNHPLAGEMLHFNGEVIGVREATAEEMAALQDLNIDACSFKFAPNSFKLVPISEELKRYFALHPEKLHDLSPRKFEELIADILKDFGFVDIELTKATRDGGFDIRAYIKTQVSVIAMLVECKKWTPPRHVGIDVIQRLHGVHHSKNANQSMIVTTSYFTQPAILESKKHGHLIKLADCNELKKWLTKYR